MSIETILQESIGRLPAWHTLVACLLGWRTIQRSRGLSQHHPNQLVDSVQLLGERWPPLRKPAGRSTMASIRRQELPSPRGSLVFLAEGRWLQPRRHGGMPIVPRSRRRPHKLPRWGNDSEEGFPGLPSIFGRPLHRLPEPFVRPPFCLRGKINSADSLRLADNLESCFVLLQPRTPR
jgi:hypothetical protein